MDAGTYAFWALGLGAAAAFLSVILKLTWWKSTVGLWFFILAGVMGFIMGFIFLLQLQVLPQWLVEQTRLIIYGLLAIVMWGLVVDIWRKNWHHWSWTKDDSG